MPRIGEFGCGAGDNNAENDSSVLVMSNASLPAKCGRKLLHTLSPEETSLVIAADRQRIFCDDHIKYCQNYQPPLPQRSRPRISSNIASRLRREVNLRNLQNSTNNTVEDRSCWSSWSSAGVSSSTTNSYLPKLQQKTSGFNGNCCKLEKIDKRSRLHSPCRPLPNRPNRPPASAFQYSPPCSRSSRINPVQRNKIIKNHDLDYYKSNNRNTNSSHLFLKRNYFSDPNIPIFPCPKNSNYQSQNQQGFRKLASRKSSHELNCGCSCKTARANEKNPIPKSKWDSYYKIRPTFVRHLDKADFQDIDFVLPPIHKGNREDNGDYNSMAKANVPTGSSRGSDCDFKGGRSRMNKNEKLILDCCYDDNNNCNCCNGDGDVDLKEESTPIRACESTSASVIIKRNLYESIPNLLSPSLRNRSVDDHDPSSTLITTTDPDYDIKYVKNRLKRLGRNFLKPVTDPTSATVKNQNENVDQNAGRAENEYFVQLKKKLACVPTNERVCDSFILQKLLELELNQCDKDREIRGYNGQQSQTLDDSEARVSYPYPCNATTKPSTCFNGPPIYIDRGHKDFVLENAIKCTRMPPKIREPCIKDDRRGNGSLLPMKRMVYKKVNGASASATKLDYGMVPGYIKRIKRQLQLEEDEVQQCDEDVLNDSVVLPDRERNALIDALSRNWEELFQEYQALPLFLASHRVIKRKSTLEDQLRELEENLRLLSRHGRLYVSNLKAITPPTCIDKKQFLWH